MVAVLVAEPADATAASVVVTGAEMTAVGFSDALGGKAVADDALITGLLITDTVLVVNPCTKVALDVAAGGTPKVGRPAVFAKVEGVAISTLVVTGVFSAFVCSLTS